MTLEQLRIFVAVADRQHLTQAAEALHLTQSAVSAAVAALERRHGIRLFDRVGRGIILTDAGRLFLTEARAVLNRAHDAEQMLSEAAGGARGRLRLAASQTVGNYWIGARMARFHAAWPGIELELFIGNTEQAAQMVVSGMADMAVVEGAVTNQGLDSEILTGDQPVLVLPPHYDSEALADMRFVAREPGSGTRTLLESWLREQGLALEDRLALELPTNEAVRSAVEAGAGATILSRLAIEHACAAGRVTCRDAGLAPRPFHLLRLRERTRTRAGDAFAAVCRDPI